MQFAVVDGRKAAYLEYNLHGKNVQEAFAGPQTVKHVVLISDLASIDLVEYLHGSDLSVKLNYVQ